MEFFVVDLVVSNSVHASTQSSASSLSESAFPAADRPAIRQEQRAEAQTQALISPDADKSTAVATQELDRVLAEIKKSRHSGELPVSSKISAEFREKLQNPLESDKESVGRREFDRAGRIIEELKVNADRLIELHRRGLDPKSDEFILVKNNLRLLLREYGELTGSQVREDMLDNKFLASVSNDRLRIVAFGGIIRLAYERIKAALKAQEKEDEEHRKEQEKREKERETNDARTRNEILRAQQRLGRRAYLQQSPNVTHAQEEAVIYEERRSRTLELQAIDERVRQVRGEAELQSVEAERMYDIDPDQLPPEVRARIALHRNSENVLAQVRSVNQFGANQPLIRYYGRSYLEVDPEVKSVA